METGQPCVPFAVVTVLVSLIVIRRTPQPRALTPTSPTPNTNPSPPRVLSARHRLEMMIRVMKYHPTTDMTLRSRETTTPSSPTIKRHAASRTVQGIDGLQSGTSPGTQFSQSKEE